MSVLLCLRPTKLHNCQHILHGAGFLSTPGTAFVSVTMKVYFSCSERQHNRAGDNQGPKAMAKRTLYQLFSFCSHFVQIPATNSKQQKEKNEVKKLYLKKNKSLLKMPGWHDKSSLILDDIPSSILGNLCAILYITFKYDP